MVVAAPLKEQSGMSHALTVKRDIKVKRVKELEDSYGIPFYAIAGTPADSVKFYLERVAKTMPDIVISGINNGANLGTDVLYSGTVGAATEGYLKNITSVAISREYDSVHSYEEIAHMSMTFIEDVVCGIDNKLLLNINFPHKIADNRVFFYASLGKRDYVNAYTKIIKPDGTIAYHVAGEIMELEPEKGTDTWAVSEGMITVTPLTLEMTDFHRLEKLKLHSK